MQTIRYENIEISLTAEFDDEHITYDDAFRKVREKVAQWVEQDLVMLGVK